MISCTGKSGNSRSTAHAARGGNAARGARTDRGFTTWCARPFHAARRVGCGTGTVRHSLTITLTALQEPNFIKHENERTWASEEAFLQRFSAFYKRPSHAACCFRHDTGVTSLLPLHWRCARRMKSRHEKSAHFKIIFTQSIDLPVVLWSQSPW